MFSRNFDWIRYLQLYTLKKANPTLKILVSLGGPDFSDDRGIADILANPSFFAHSTVAFLRRHHFDGIDLYLQNISVHKAGKRRKLIALLCKGLHNKFEAESKRTRRPRLILTVAVPARKTAIDTSYNLLSICRTADFINLLTFNFVDTLLKRTAFDAPLRQPRGQHRLWKQNSVEWTASYAVFCGCPRAKVVIGMPLFGKAYRLTNASTTVSLPKAGSPINGPAPPGLMLHRTPFYAYFEIRQTCLHRQCERGWDKAHDAPFLCHGNIWVTYDNPHSLKKKVRWLVSQGYGGWVAFSIDLDNFHGGFPLLTTLKETTPVTKIGHTTVSLSTTSLPVETPESSLSAAAYIDRSTQGQNNSSNTTGSQSDMTTRPTINVNETGYKRICSVNARSQQRHGLGKFRLTEVDPSLCSHLIIDHARMLDDGIAFNDTSIYADLAVLKQKKPKLKTILSVDYRAFKSMGKASGLRSFGRERVTGNVAAFLRMLHFDGIHWHDIYDDKGRFIRLLKTFRKAFDVEAATSHRPSLLLSADTFPSGITSDRAIAAIARYVDFVALMTFNLRGSHSNRTAQLIAPLRVYYDDDTGHQNAALLADQAVKRGCPPEKIIVGFSAAGYSFRLAKATETEPGSHTIGPGRPGPYTQSSGVYAYFEVCQLFIYGGGTRQWTSRQAAPYIYNHSNWVTYEDQYSLHEKVAWLKRRHLAGWLFWSLDFDDFNGHFCRAGRWPLLHALKTALLGEARYAGTYQHARAYQHANTNTTMHSNSMEPLQTRTPLDKTPVTTERQPAESNGSLLHNGDTLTEKLF
ncbi:Chitinase-3-like protein 1 [Lamellibrachia satsuma]|nr:Chitinase-3-like protein 1 [Lamellibrachia satsuma]